MSVFSKFKVSVDGKEVAQLGHGKSAKVEVEPGSHTVHVHSFGTDGTTEINVPESGYQLCVGYKEGLGSAMAAGRQQGGPTVEFWTPDRN